MSVKISTVEPHSPASRHKIHPGDVLISINSHEIVDVLDYRFYIGEKRLVLMLRRGDGRERRVVLHKREQDDIGLGFDTYLMDKQQSCKNKCVFCFIDQMPKGMRESLYFKDDDSRLTFLFGNYITLTGLTEREIQRIIDMHISPINISVHTMNPTLRVEMMKNPKAGECLGILKRFAAAGISMNTQLVLCPGINDGQELERSLRELGELYPSVQSIAAVPVGLTKHREGLCKLECYEKHTAGAVIDTVESFARDFYEKNGTHLAYAADEFYLKAGRPMPGEDHYEDYPQLENGVGMWTLLKSEFMQALSETEAREVNRAVSLVTGVAAYPLIKELCDCACQRFERLRAEVYGIENDFFGHSVTVAGLVTGQDIINQLKGRELFSQLILPRVMLRSEGDMMLDGVTPDEISEALGVPVRVTDNGAQALLEALIG